MNLKILFYSILQMFENGQRTKSQFSALILDQHKLIFSPFFQLEFLIIFVQILLFSTHNLKIKALITHLDRPQPN